MKVVVYDSARKLLSFVFGVFAGNYGDVRSIIRSSNSVISPEGNLEKSKSKTNEYPVISKHSDICNCHHDMTDTPCCDNNCQNSDCSFVGNCCSRCHACCSEPINTRCSCSNTSTNSQTPVPNCSFVIQSEPVMKLVKPELDRVSPIMDRLRPKMATLSSFVKEAEPEAVRIKPMVNGMTREANVMLPLLAKLDTPALGPFLCQMKKEGLDFSKVENNFKLLVPEIERLEPFIKCVAPEFEAMNDIINCLRPEMARLIPKLRDVEPVLKEMEREVCCISSDIDRIFDSVNDVEKCLNRLETKLAKTRHRKSDSRKCSTRGGDSGVGNQGRCHTPAWDNKYRAN